ncbi:hypothetical protein [Sulfitobacter sp. PM12]|uniref:hypothetical protein n=1 Tax=Sulfitobacter sp. PM12 TaxID=3138497 RepID=UPI00388F7966
MSVQDWVTIAVKGYNHEGNKLSDWVGSLTASDWIAGYAALVATFLAGLEGWKWFWSGPKVKLRISLLDTEKSIQRQGIQVHIVNAGQFDVTIVQAELVRRSQGKRYPVTGYLFPEEWLPYRLLQNDELSFPISQADYSGGDIFLEVKAAHRVTPYTLRLPDIGGRKF